MFLPLHDNVPLRHVREPFANWLLLGANLTLYAAIASGYLGNNQQIDMSFGIIPSVLLNRADLTGAILQMSPKWTLLTSLFVHYSFWHLAGNMLFLYVFGDNIEDAMGPWRYLAFYLVCGISAGLFYAWWEPDSDAPLIGASGAIAGIVGAYLVLYPRVHVLGLVFNWLPLSIPAWLCLGFWMLFQLGEAVLGRGDEVGWWAHVGGILAGVVLIGLFKYRDVPLFSPENE